MVGSRVTAVVMSALAAALLAACTSGGHSRTATGYSAGYRVGTVSDWYDYRHDVVGCRGEAQRTGRFPGDSYDSYVRNCVYDRQSERDREE